MPYPKCTLGNLPFNGFACKQIAMIVLLCGVFGGTVESANFIKARSYPLPVTRSTPGADQQNIIELSYSVRGQSVHIHKRISRVHGRIGVGLRELSKDRRAKSLIPHFGVYISSVRRGGGAEKGGLKARDIVLVADGQNINRIELLIHIIANHDRQQPLSLTIERQTKDEEPKLIELQVNILEETTEVRRNSSFDVEVFADSIHSGATLGLLEGEVARYFFDQPNAKGVILLKCKGGAPIFYSDFRPGDLLLEVDKKPATSLEEIQQQFAAAAKDDRPVSIQARRGLKGFNAQFQPRQSKPGSHSFQIPLVVGWSARQGYSQFELVEGLVFDYHWSAYSDKKGEPRETTGWSLPLNLIEYRGSATTVDFEIGWGLVFNYESSAPLAASGKKVTKNWSLPLDLVGYSKSGKRKTFYLLWGLIPFSWQ